MSTYDKLDTINDSLNDIKTAIIGKGQTPSGNITTYATAISNISQQSAVIEPLSITPTTSAQTITAPSGTDGYSPVSVAAVTASIDSNISAENIKKDVTILNVVGTYEGSGGGGGSGKYQLLQRISDDSNNEIGTVSGFFTDANDVEYAVVCLDARYRIERGDVCSSNTAITNLPSYSDHTMWSASETSTFNTQKIIDYCTANGYTSGACSHCRSKSFTIDGTTYYGQLPNIQEGCDIMRQRTNINTLDTSATSYPDVIIPSSGQNVWSSTQAAATGNYHFYMYGGIRSTSKFNESLTIPVIEIPNA